jgi:hypothetical protein
MNNTVFMDDLPSNMAEYVAAKSAGKSIFALLHKKHPSMNIFKPRLPEEATGQTASLLPADKKDPALLLLEKLRQFQATDTMMKKYNSKYKNSLVKCCNGHFEIV